MAEQSPRVVYASNGWEIDLTRRELRSRGVSVPIGGRAFEILEVLVRSDGELISKYHLMEHVWPGAVVEENTLQFHISAIRKMLGADRGLLKTESGRGYRLLGRWDVQEATEPGHRVGIAERKPRQLFRTNVPIAGSALIGRSASRQHLLDALSAYRVVTLTGPGGIGKSVLALEIARGAFPTLQGDCWLVELASLSDPALVPAAVSVAIGLRMEGSEISAEAVAQALDGEKLLLVLDNCEHLVDAAARLAEAIVRVCPNASVLATSREILRTEGEYVYRVPPLDVPPLRQEDTDVVHEYSAVQLFNARLMAFDAGSSAGAENLPLTAAICRRLDGIPLAIEFAAARASTLGLQQTADLLSDRFSLLTAGRRMALPRHRTLRATLDWSYELLSESERTLLRRLAICAGGFTLEAATAVMGDAGATASMTASMVAEGIASLAAKSLVSLDASVRSGRWRLLETIRDYALEKLAEIGERERLARTHAEYYRELLEGQEIEARSGLTSERLADCGREIDNLRAALDWAFSPGGDASLGVALTGVAVPWWMQLSLLEECRSRVEQALSVLEARARGDARREMELHAALGTVLIHIRPTSSPEIAVVWTKALEIAERLEDAECQLWSLWGLWYFHSAAGQTSVALTLAQRCCDLGAVQPDPNDRLVGEQLLGVTQHSLGDQPSARRHLERVQANYVITDEWRETPFQSYLRATFRAYLARILWLQGFPDQAVRAAASGLEDARTGFHAQLLCHVLGMTAFPIAQLVGDLVTAERYAETLLDHSTRHELPRWRAVGYAYQGVLDIMRGDLDTGLRLLRASGDALRGPESAAVRLIAFLTAEALGQMGHIADGLAAVEKALASAERTDERWSMAELLRVKGELFLLQGAPEGVATAEDYFQQALDLARRQGALGWELRAATSLARLLRAQDRSTDATALLRPVYDRFTEGFDTADLKAAKTLLDALQ